MADVSIYTCVSSRSLAPGVRRRFKLEDLHAHNVVSITAFPVADPEKGHTQLYELTVEDIRARVLEGDFDAKYSVSCYVRNVGGRQVDKYAVNFAVISPSDPDKELWHPCEQEEGEDEMGG
ncbi:MAG: hypothetical protein J5I90_09440 [Caldilineales bacterium]|nr:hypothetical protein [Caldilineales bacterium]